MGPRKKNIEGSLSSRITLVVKFNRDEIKSSGKNSILNSFKIAQDSRPDAPPPLYSKGEFLMLTAAYNIKHNNKEECRYHQKAFQSVLDSFPCF